MNKNMWTKEHENKVVELFNKKYKVSEIADDLNRSASNVAKKCRELGLKSPMGIMMAEQKEARGRGMIICRGCTEEKPIDNFPLRERGKKYVRCLCRECGATASLQRYRNKKNCTLEETLHQRAYQAKRRSEKKQLEFNLTDSDLLEIYKKQNGKCYYSGITMEKIPKIDNYYNVSIDRVDSSKGYTKNNVVLCCDSINTMKNSMPIKIFIDICQKIVLHQVRKV